MEIRPVIADQDEGIWQCHVTVHQKGDTYTLTSRSRVKNVRKYQQSKDGSRSQLSQLLYQEDSIAPKKEPTSSFTRQEHNTVEISRDIAERQQTVVFDRRTLPEPSHGSSTGRQMAVVDYEDDSNANSGYSILERHNRKRHRQSPDYASTQHVPSVLYLFVMILLITS
uniref:Uncharacterized protein n=1 Tax=Parascaris univalens TaxID=6257 RepID=A0A915C8D3_PARUN